MVCKNCGNELIEGINICPYCGENSNQEEPKNLMSEINDLKIDTDSSDNNIQDENDIAVTQDLDNLKKEIEALLLNSEDSNDLELNNGEFEEQNLNNIEMPSITPVVDSIEPINIDIEKVNMPKADINFDTIDMSNYINDNEKKEKDDNIDGDLNSQIEVFDPKKEKEELEHEKELSKDEPLNSIEIDNLKPINLGNEKNDISDELETSEEKEIDETKNSDVPDIQNLIDNIKEIPTEDIKSEENNTQEKEDSNTNDDITNTDETNEPQDLNSIEIGNLESIQLEDKDENDTNETKEVSEDISNDVPDIQNLIDNIKEIPMEDTKKDIDKPKIEIENNKSENSDNLNTDNLIQDLKKIDINGIPEVKSFENKEEKKFETPIKNDFLLTAEFPQSTKENNIELNEEPKADDLKDKVYINENLILNPNQTTLLMPQENINNEQIQNIETPNDKDSEKNKQAKGFNMTILFICMVVLGILVALVVSYIFNM